MSAGAILFAGFDDRDGEHSAYANDLALWRRLLIEGFGVPAFRVRVLLANGGRVLTTEPAGYLDAAAATAAELDSAVRTFSDLAPEDPFFFVASNHGTRATTAGCAGLLCADRSALLPAEAKELFSSLASRHQIFVLGQCGSGGFASLAGPNRAVLAGCRADQYTHVRKDDEFGRTWQWTEFLYDMAAALGADPLVAASSETLADAFAVVEARSMRRRESPDGSWPLSVDLGGLARGLRRRA